MKLVDEKLFKAVSFDSLKGDMNEMRRWTSLDGSVCVIEYAFKLFYGNSINGPFFLQKEQTSSRHSNSQELIECDVKLLSLNTTTNRWTRFQVPPSENKIGYLSSSTEQIKLYWNSSVRQSDRWSHLQFFVFDDQYREIAYIAYIPKINQYIVSTTTALGSSYDLQVWCGVPKAMTQENEQIDIMRAKDGGTTYITVGRKYLLYFPTRRNIDAKPDITFLQSGEKMDLQTVQVPDEIGFCRDYLGLDVSCFVDIPN